jgi:hypothetical protein
VNGTPRNDWGMFTDLEPGDYEVCFGDVANYLTPACDTVTVASGGTTQVTGNYTSSPGAVEPSGYGMLRVVTDPAVPSQILIDGVAYDSWGLNWVKLSPGNYQVSFADVAGYVTPADQTATVSADVTTEITGSFVQQGQLRVITSPPVSATVFVNGVPRNDWGMWTDLVPGDYQICFGAVAGYATPGCQPATIIAGTTTTITGTYN